MRRLLYAALPAAAAALFACVLLWPRPHPETPIAVAAERDVPAWLEAALAAGADPNQRNADGYTPLIWAVRNGREGAITRLVRAGADPDRRDEAVNGWTPLLHAVHKDQLGAVRALLAAGAQVDGRSRNGTTPLMLAAAQANAGIAEALLAAGADPRAESPGGGSVLRQAVFGGNRRIAEDLVRAAPGLHLGDGFGDTMARLYARLRSGSRFAARLDGLRQEIR